MGGARKIPYPKWVSAPSGAYYGAQDNNPKNWKTMTALVLCAMGATTGMIWRVSDQHTKEYKRPELIVPKSTHGHH